MPRRASRYIQPRIPPAGKLARKTAVQDNGCWYFTGGLDADGYGQIGGYHATTGKPTSFRAHRIAYEEKYGPIAEGYVLDHVCHDPTSCVGGYECPHRRCVNPEHVVPSSVAFNGSAKRRVIRPEHPGIIASAASKRARTHCGAGHTYSADTMYLDGNGHRRCLVCIRGWSLGRKKTGAKRANVS